jgi:hypothetical protein
MYLNLYKLSNSYFGINEKIESNNSLLYRETKIILIFTKLSSWKQIILIHTPLRNWIRRIRQLISKAFFEHRVCSGGFGYWGDFEIVFERRIEICLSCEFKIHLEEFRITQKRIMLLQDEYLKQSIHVSTREKPNLSAQICQEDLPEASRFAIGRTRLGFWYNGYAGQAKHLATLYLEFWFYCGCGCNFGFSRYAERLGRSANSFDELYEALKEPTYIDILLSILKEK